ncbi:MAG: hypothetical protein IPN53_05240 [Comamonadaceae bacterium]|nr:hypothetical protein [Comamonadaceae bacterium]
MITTKNDPVSASSVVMQHDKTTRPVNFIRFHGLTLLVVENGCIEYIDPRPLCELAGLQWKGAQRTMMSGDNLTLYGTRRLIPPAFGTPKVAHFGAIEASQDVSEADSETPGYPETGLIHIRLDRSRMFLARVNTNQMRVQGNGDAADFLLTLQIEWAEALHSYETNGIAVKKGRREDLGDLGLLYKLRGMAETPEERAALARQIADHHKEMGYPLTPDRQQIPLFEGGAS